MQEIILNKPDWAKTTDWYLTDIPTSCKVLVPTGCVKEYQNHPQWGKLKVQAGAFDFTYGKGFSVAGPYYMTVLFRSPQSHEGVPYDDLAKYVYHPNIHNATYFEAALFETDDMLDSGNRFLITDIGDSCFSRTKADWNGVINFSKLTALRRIGHSAFWQSNFKAVKLPAGVIEIKPYAFYNMPNLTDFYVARPKPIPITDAVFRDADLQRATLHVPTQAAVDAYKAAPEWKKFYKIVCDAKLGDIDGNGVVNVSDVTALINKILGIASFDDAICDIDGNSVVNVSDVTTLINIIPGGS